MAEISALRQDAQQKARAQGDQMQIAQRQSDLKQLLRAGQPDADLPAFPRAQTY